LAIDAQTGTIAADRCAVENLQVSDSEVRFTRRDEALPTYFDPEVGAVFPYTPVFEQVNRYPLKVSGLQAGKWRLTVDGVEAGIFTSEALAQGINLATQPGPWQTLAKAVNELVADQEGIYLQERELKGIFHWRATPPPEAEAEKLALIRKLDQTVAGRERAWCELVRDRTWEWCLVSVP
jgi:hypothetical protein